MTKKNIAENVKKYKEYFEKVGEEECLDQMKSDGLNDDDAGTVLAAIKKDKDSSGGDNNGDNETGKNGSVVSPNNAIKKQLASFDYNNLVDDEFVRYCEFVQGLKLNDKYDFEVYRVEAVKQVRYEGVPGSPVDITGIRIKDIRPKHTTRIPVKAALLNNGTLRKSKNFAEVLNEQFDLKGQRGVALYYLLKK